HEWIGLLRVMLGYGLFPTVIGTGLGAAAFTTWGRISFVVVVAGFIAGGSWLVLRHRFRASTLLFFFVGTFLVALPIATARITAGTSEGLTSRYITFLPMLLAIAVAGAVSPRPDESVGTEPFGAPPNTSSARAMPWSSAMTIGVATITVVALYFANLTATFQMDASFKNLGDHASLVSGNIASGLRSLDGNERSSLVDSSAPWPVWYGVFLGLIVKNGRMSQLMAYWTTNVHAFGEEPDLTEIGGSGVLLRATFEPVVAGDRFEQITVHASSPTLMTIDIKAIRPTEIETPWKIPVQSGVHSFVVPAWSSHVESVHVTGERLRVLRIRPGSVTVGRPF
ncbi:MAG: hypothetical protein ACRD6W_06440, partial [Nitrososphaerales archaeon]